VFSRKVGIVRKTQQWIDENGHFRLIDHPFIPADKIGCCVVQLPLSDENCSKLSEGFTQVASSGLQLHYDGRKYITMKSGRQFNVNKGSNSHYGKI